MAGEEGRGQLSCSSRPSDVRLYRLEQASVRLTVLEADSALCVIDRVQPSDVADVGYRRERDGRSAGARSTRSGEMVSFSHHTGRDRGCRGLPDEVGSHG